MTDAKADAKQAPHYYVPVTPRVDGIDCKLPDRFSLPEDALPNNDLLNEAEQLLFNIRDEIPRKSLIL